MKLCFTFIDYSIKTLARSRCCDKNVYRFVDVITFEQIYIQFNFIKQVNFYIFLSPSVNFFHPSHDDERTESERVHTHNEVQRRRKIFV
jgi:hypothetical protein